MHTSCCCCCSSDAPCSGSPQQIYLILAPVLRQMPFLMPFYPSLELALRVNPSMSGLVSLTVNWTQAVMMTDQDPPGITHARLIYNEKRIFWDLGQSKMVEKCGRHHVCFWSLLANKNNKKFIFVSYTVQHSEFHFFTYYSLLESWGQSTRSAMIWHPWAGLAHQSNSPTVAAGQCWGLNHKK